MRAGDRLLVTSLGDRSRLREYALRVSEGALVGLGTEDEVRAARAECADLDHVMFVVGSREEIPWAEAWFDLIIDEDPERPTRAMQRVLAPTGRMAGKSL